MINASICPAKKPVSCDNDEKFSFTEGQCSKQSESCSDNTTVAQGDFDYEHISSYMVYTTTGYKLILIETKSQRLQLQEGDLIGVRFPATGPPATLKTSLSSFSLLYSSSVLNTTGTQTLRGNRLPLTEESPTKVNYAPAVAIRYSAASETYFEHRYQKAGHEKVSFTLENAREKSSFTKEIAVQEGITGLELKLPDALPSTEVVNISVELLYGTNVSYLWDFGDGKNDTTTTPWVTHRYEATGTMVVNLIATNRVSLVSIWCSTIIQEKIAGLEFRNNALLSIQNGTTASIGWLLRNGSHVDFNISVESPEGENHTANLTNAKAPGAIFFAIYKTNISNPGLYLVTITAVNKLGHANITGNLSVQRIISGVSVIHPVIVKTNQTFNFTIQKHQGEETANYVLLTMDVSTTTTDKVIPYTYRKGGRYKVVLIASNDISSSVAHCQEVIVQDVIEGLEFESFDHNVGVMAEARVHWKVSQGSEITILVDYGDNNTNLFKENITVADIFLAISSHNYSAPGDYLFQVTVSNQVDNKTINTTIHVETPVQGAILAVGRGSLHKAEGGPCAKGEVLYIAVNESVTATATVSNGTNVKVLFDFGTGSLNKSYFHREFPENGTTLKYFYSEAGVYNITVTLLNRNPENVTSTCMLIVQNPIGVVKLESNSPRPSSPGAVEFHVEFLTQYELLRPLYFNYSFGDNVSRNHLKNKDNITHNYTGQGVYIAIVEVSNEINSSRASVEVKVQDKVYGLNFTANVTSYVNECPQRESFFPHKDVFPLEYDIFFNASIINGTNVTYTWNFSDGHIIEGISCRHKFNKTGDHNISLLAKNEVSNDTKEMKITVEESILGVSLENDGPVEKDHVLNFTLRMKKKGNNSCFKIDLKDSKPIYYKTGTPFVSCKGAIDLESPKNFTHTYNKAQDYNVTLTAENRVSCVWIRNHESKASVVKGHCIYPIIRAEIGKSKETPTEYKRSKKIDIKTTNVINCYNISLTRFQWHIYQLLGDKGTEFPSGDLKTDKSDLHIPARRLEYGLYELIFRIDMKIEPGVFTEEKFYIKIIPSELVAIIDGGTERTVGNVAPLDLNAAKSNDPDSDPSDNSDYNFAWFCKQEDDVYTLPTNLTNLPPIPVPPPKPINASDVALGLGGCFDYGPGQLNFTSQKTITLNTSRMIPNTTYIIRFVMTKDNREKFADQIVKVRPGDPPILKIE